MLPALRTTLMDTTMTMTMTMNTGTITTTMAMRTMGTATGIPMVTTAMRMH